MRAGRVVRTVVFEAFFSPCAGRKAERQEGGREVSQMGRNVGWQDGRRVGWPASLPEPRQWRKPWLCVMGSGCELDQKNEPVMQ